MLHTTENSSLLKFNTFGIDVKCSKHIIAHSFADVLEFTQMYKNQPLLILGGGSNVLFTSNFDGIVFQPLLKGMEVVHQTQNHVYLRVAAGELWDDVVNFSVSNHWWGIENLSLIQGSAGAAPIQNIGAYGVELKDVLTKVETIDLQTTATLQFSNEVCNFGYRDSIFKQKFKNTLLITAITLKLSKHPQPQLSYSNLSDVIGNKTNDLQAIRNAIIHIRNSKLPNVAELGNAGSFFKNPVIENSHFEELKNRFETIQHYKQANNVKIPAGWLIEQCGWKGKKKGNVGVYEQQALILVNYGNASGNEVLQLVEEIKKSVYEKFNIKLQEEVNIV